MEQYKVIVRKRKRNRNWGCSVVEGMFLVHGALSSIPNTKQKSFMAAQYIHHSKNE
jgi:hypothetical protein